MKLWNKDNTDTSGLIENFTVGNDREFDILLASYDVQGSIAHVKMLSETGLMTVQEAGTAINALDKIQKDIQAGKFSINEGVEDVHSQVELLLTEMIGQTGKKNP